MSSRRPRAPQTDTRSYPALGPLSGAGSRDIARGLWGRQWISCVEDPGTSSSSEHGYGYGGSAGRDSRLARARTYARRGAVGEITVRPGSISARVRGSRRTPYRCDIQVPQLTEARWDRLLKGWAEAAEGVLPELAHGLLGPQAYEAARSAQVELVPGPGRFTYHCGCPDWGDPCKHAAALAYVFARQLEEQGEALLQLLGRDLAEVRTAVAARRQEAELAQVEDAWSAADAKERGVAAAEVFTRSREPGGLPALPPLPAALPPGEHGRPDDLTAGSVVGEDLDPEPLWLLAADAAGRAADAYACAVGAPFPQRGAPADPGNADGPADRLRLDTDRWQDTVRHAAAGPAPYLLERLVNSSDQARAHLARASVAWRYGGPRALAAMGGEQVPGPAYEAAAREQLARFTIAGRADAPRLRRARGRLRLLGEDMELRWGPDGRWYPYAKERGRWWAAGPPSTSAVEALRGALMER